MSQDNREMRSLLDGDFAPPLSSWKRRLGWVAVGKLERALQSWPSLRGCPRRLKTKRKKEESEEEEKEEKWRMRDGV